MRPFFHELKLRNVYKVAVAYGVIAWLLIQAVFAAGGRYGARWASCL